VTATILGLMLTILCAGNGTAQAEGSPQATSRRNSLIATALTRAAVTEKDVPDFDGIHDKQRIPLLDTTEWGQAWGEKIPLDALPKIENVKFILLSKEELQRRANEQGAFAYLAVGRVAVEASSATIYVGTHWALPEPRDSRIVYLCGGAYELRYTWRNGKWLFDRILGIGIS